MINRKDNLFFFALLILGLVASYFASLKEEGLNIGRLQLSGVNSNAVYKIELKRGSTQVVAQRRDAGGRFWFERQATNPNGQQIRSSFLGSTKVDDFLAKFDPLFVDRDLGPYDETKATEYGFKADDVDTLRLYGKDAEVLYEVTFGAKSYGSGDVFTRVKGSDRLYLLNGRDLEKLFDADRRLIEKKPFRIDEENKIRITASLLGDEKRFYFEPEKRSKPAVWGIIDSSEETVPSEMVATWIKSLSKVRIKRYASESEVSSYENMEDVMKVKLQKENIEVRRFKPGDGDFEYWVNSDVLSHPALLEKQRIENLLGEFKQIK